MQKDIDDHLYVQKYMYHKPNFDFDHHHHCHHHRHHHHRRHHPPSL